LRATKGFIKSLVELLKLPFKVTDHKTLYQRQKTIKMDLPRSSRTGQSNLHIVVDATGLKVFGEGEWKVRQHGYSKRRTWLRLHLALDASSQELIGLVLTTHKVADSDVVIDLLKSR